MVLQEEDQTFITNNLYSDEIVTAMVDDLFNKFAVIKVI